MQKLFLTIVFVIGLTPLLFSQNTTETYCQITALETGIPKKYKILADFGTGQIETLTDPKSGLDLKFETIVEGLNYLAKQGWQVINFTTTKDSNSNTEHHYLLRKTTEIKK
jgi:hypothetical protein